MIYPDLSAGRAPTPFGRRLRSLLFMDLLGLAFRPIRLVEVLLPKFKVPSSGQTTTDSAARFVRRLGLALANIIAIAGWKGRQWRRREAANPGPQ